MNSIYSGADAPCKGCERPTKELGCHGKCAEYLEYKAKREADKQERAKLRRIAEEIYLNRRRR